MIGFAAALMFTSIAASDDAIVVEVGRPATTAVCRGDEALGTHGSSRRCQCTVRFDIIVHVFTLAPGRDP